MGICRWAVVGAEVVAAEEVLVADGITATIRASGLRSEGIVAAASALRLSPLQFGHLERRSLSLLPERAAVSHLEPCAPRALQCGGLFVPAEAEPEFRL